MAFDTSGEDGKQRLKETRMAEVNVRAAALDPIIMFLDELSLCEAYHIMRMFQRPTL